MVQRYLDEKEDEAVSLNVGADMRKINYCFRLLKEHYVNSTKELENLANSVNHQPKPSTVTIIDSSHYDNKEMKELKDTLRQRDHEIS
jgi:hypothetical protein